MDGARETGCLRAYRHFLSHRREEIAARWYAAIAHQTFSPFAASEILTHLGALVAQAVAILTDASFAADAAEEIGATLVRLRYLDPTTLSETITVLGEEFGKEIPIPLHDVLRERIPALLGAVAAGHERAARVLVLDEQEGIREALLVERDRIMAALRESESRFRAIFADAPIGIVLADLEGHAVECNRAVERILGYRQEELRRLVFTDITHPDDRAADRTLYIELIEGKRRSYHNEKRYLHRHGHVVRCDLTVSLLHAADGTPQFALAMIEDMTAQPRTSDTFSHHVRRDTLPTTATPLTKRQRELLHLVAEGLSDDDIADQICRSPGTIRKHLQMVYRALGVRDRHAAVRAMREREQIS